MSEKPTQPAQRIDKPWGHELIWARTKDYVAKILFIKAGESLSLQYHRKKEETLYLESGECQVEVGTSVESLKTLRFRPGNVLHVPPETIHRLTAVTDCRFFEVSTPELDDVVRIQDKYGRTQTP